MNAGTMEKQLQQSHYARMTFAGNFPRNKELPNKPVFHHPRFKVVSTWFCEQLRAFAALCDKK
jgi:hypothetical protein